MLRRAERARPIQRAHDVEGEGPACGRPRAAIEAPRRPGEAGVVRDRARQDIERNGLELGALELGGGRGLGGGVEAIATHSVTDNFPGARFPQGSAEQIPAACTAAYGNFDIARPYQEWEHQAGVK